MQSLWIAIVHLQWLGLPYCVTEEAPLLLQKVFDKGVSSSINTATYLSDTLQLLNMESVLYSKQGGAPCWPCGCVFASFFFSISSMHCCTASLQFRLCSFWQTSQVFLSLWLVSLFVSVHHSSKMNAGFFFLFTREAGYLNWLLALRMEYTCGMCMCHTEASLGLFVDSCMCVCVRVCVCVYVCLDQYMYNTYTVTKFVCNWMSDHCSFVACNVCPWLR